MLNVRYYYIRDEKRVPIVTVCLMQGENKVSRGIAICNLELEFPIKHDGRRLAHYRARIAYTNKESTEKIRQRFFSTRNYLYKSHYMPILTIHERKLLRNHLLYREF